MHYVSVNELRLTTNAKNGGKKLSILKEQEENQGNSWSTSGGRWQERDRQQGKSRIANSFSASVFTQKENIVKSSSMGDRRPMHDKTGRNWLENI